MKKRVLKTTGIILLIFVAVPLAVVYVWSTIIIDKTYSMPLTHIAVPAGSAAILEGERLVHIEHCSHCHGEKWSGGVVEKIDYVGEVIAPDISTVIPKYTDDELVRLIRNGVKKDGKSIYVMPSFMYHNLTDEAVGKMIAYLRTIPPVPPTPGIAENSSWYPWGRLQMIQGKIPTIAETKDMHYCSDIHLNTADTSQVARGRYLVTCGCTSCHGGDLKGRKGFSPDLIIATSYSKEKFMHLLHTGEGGLGRKNVTMMSDVAKNNLSYLHDDEIEAIYAYLQTAPSQKNK